MMSALPPKADIERFGWNVCLGPIADITQSQLLCARSRPRLTLRREMSASNILRSVHFPAGEGFNHGVHDC